MTKLTWPEKSHVNKLLVIVNKLFVDCHLTTFDFSVEFQITKPEKQIHSNWKGYYVITEHLYSIT